MFDSPGRAAQSFDYIEQRVRQAIGAEVPFDILGVSPWAMACEVADRFHDGNVFLVGDAAHRLPPTGGLGMNTGIQDVENLAWKLAAVVNGWASAAILDTYSRERRPIGITNAVKSRRNASAMDHLYNPIAAISAGSLDDIPGEDLAGLLNEQWDHLNSPALQFGYSYEPDPDGTAATGRYTPSGAVGHRLPHTFLGQDLPGEPVVDRISLSSFTVIANGMAVDFEKLAQDSPVPIEILDIAGHVSDDWLTMVGLQERGAGVIVRPDTHIIIKCAAPTNAEWAGVQDTLSTYTRSSAAGPDR